MMTKKILMMAFVAVATLQGVSAQDIKKGEVPEIVREAFAKAYPKITVVDWEKEGNDYEASFEEGKVEISVVIDAKGNIVEVEKEIEKEDLPKAVKSAVAGKNVKEAAIITKNGKTFYEVEIGGKDLFFNARGQSVTL